MAATVVIVEQNGPSAGPTESLDVANVNFGNVAQAEIVTASNPITAQADGHAFEKWLRIYVSNLGTSTVVDNLKLWLSNLGGGWKTGEGMSCNMRTSGYVADTYPTLGPVETDSAAADQAMPESEPSGPNLGIGGSLSGQIVTAPAYSDWAVIQLDVTASTPAGAVNQKTITFQYDEM
jgi:hypothetical protein